MKLKKLLTSNEFINAKTRDLLSLECSNCDSTFQRRKREIKKASKIDNEAYCSRACRTSFLYKEDLSCSVCRKKFTDYKLRSRKYCSEKCAATVNCVSGTKSPRYKHGWYAEGSTLKPKLSPDGRKLKPSRGSYEVTCIQCSQKVIRQRPQKFCSLECSANHKTLKRIASGKFSHITAKKYLLQTHGNKCSSCNNSEWQNKPIPIELDHIDGNSKDNSLSNLRLLCPNCHAQTPTYKNRNKGNGRAYRRKRYAEGKSY